MGTFSWCGYVFIEFIYVYKHIWILNVYHYEIWMLSTTKTILWQETIAASLRSSIFTAALDSTWLFIVSKVIGFHLPGSLEFQLFTGFQYSKLHSTAKTSKTDMCQNGIQCLFKRQESKILLWLNFIGYSPARLYCVYWTRPSQSVPPNLRPIGS